MGAVRKEAADLPEPAVLVLDEIGYLPLARADPNMVFQLVARRYERGSILLSRGQSNGVMPILRLCSSDA
jgi:DNA replication protein DnaC